jgi:hypothetical protein
MLYFSKRAHASKNPCRVGTLTGGLPQPSEVNMAESAVKYKAKRELSDYL